MWTVRDPPSRACCRAETTVCAAADVPAEAGDSRRLNCDSGFGSAGFVTGAFGLVAAGVAVAPRVAEV